MLEVERCAVDFNFVERGNGVVAKGKQLKINLRLIDAGNEFVALIENFHVANNHVAVAVEVEQVNVIQVDTADFYGHAQFLRGSLFSSCDCLCDNFCPL